MLCALPVHFVRSDAILPNECHYPEHAASLAETLRREQLWRIPIVLECNSLAVMDGHHRLQAALQLKLAYVPCLLLGYGDVEVIATREGYLVTPQEIVRRARAQDLYPPKTTRHRFPSALPTCNVSVCLLCGRSDRAADACRIARPADGTKMSGKSSLSSATGTATDRVFHHFTETVKDSIFLI